MKNFAILFGGGLILLSLRLATDSELRHEIKKEYDTIAPAYLYEADSSEIKHLREMKAEEKGEGK